MHVHAFMPYAFALKHMLPQHTLRSHVTPAQLYRPQAASRAGHRAGYRRTGSPAERDPGHHHHGVHAHHSAAVRSTQPPRERPAGRLVHPGHGAAPQQHQRHEEQRDSRRVEQPRRTAATQRLLHAPPARCWQWLRALERRAERAGERARLLLPQRFGRLLSRDRQALQPRALRESGRLVQQGGLLLQRGRAGCKGCLALPQARQLRKASPPVSVVLYAAPSASSGLHCFTKYRKAMARKGVRTGLSQASRWAISSSSSAANKSRAGDIVPSQRASSSAACLSGLKEKGFLHPSQKALQGTQLWSTGKRPASRL